MQSIPALMAVVNTNKTVTESTEKISRMQDVYVKGKGIADGIFFFFSKIHPQQNLKETMHWNGPSRAFSVQVKVPTHQVRCH